MQQEQVPGGAGPALAAHSKDASAPGSPASQHTAPSGGNETRGGESGGGASETMRGLTDRARDAAGQAAATAGQVSQRLQESGARATDAVGSFIQERPVTALAITALACLLIGAAIGRRG